MSAKRKPSSHLSRFRHWQNLCPPATRFLSTAVNTELVPILESQGFVRVDISLGDPQMAVSGSEIEIERSGEGVIDCIAFNFEKYRTPRFQVHFSRRLSDETRAFVRSGNLVPRASRYYFFWGKPWWLPTRLWSDRASRRAVSSVASRLPEAVRFLETGELGPSISKRTSRHASGSDA